MSNEIGARSLREALGEGVVLTQYMWPLDFARERDRLTGLFPAEFVAVEHFGSTAVPGLPAKPVIDLLAGLEDTRQLDAMTDSLATLTGYEYVDSLNRGIVGRRWLFRHHRGRRIHQLHLLVHGSYEWFDRQRSSPSARRSCRASGLSRASPSREYHRAKRSG